VFCRGIKYELSALPPSSDFEVLIGRNNRQNDQLTFRLAGDYDLWFHAQEIPGSHVLLRLEPELCRMKRTCNLP